MIRISRYSAALLFILCLLQTSLSAQDIALSPPVFSHASGFFFSSFELTISTSEPGARIIYTLDGSEPLEQSIGGNTYRYKNAWPQNPGNPFGPFLTGASNTYVYQRPIRILNRESNPDSLTRRSSAYDRSNYYFPNDPVFKGTVVKTRIIKEGYEPGPVVTNTYFVHPDGRNRFSLPVICINTNEENLFDYDTGIYTPGIVFDQWRQSNPGQTADGGRPANYNRRGDAWERTGHMAFFETGSSVPVISQDIGFRTHGGWSRSAPMKSLRIYARSEFGETRFNHTLFSNPRYNEYKRFVLRNSGNDWNFSMFRDALIHEIISPMHFDTQDYRPSVLFINGEYWGVHNIRERYDQHYIKRVYDVDEADLDMLTNNASVTLGENRHYVETISYIRNNGVIAKAHYDYVKSRIDLESFIDYQIANIFAGNGDWPGNNIDFWRKRTDSYQPDSAYGHDGRWRWMAYDMDFGFDLYSNSLNQNFLAFATQAGSGSWPNPDWSTFLLRSLFENAEFKSQFIGRFSDMLNTLFLPDRMLEILESFREALLPEMPEHITRWKQPGSMGSWENQVVRMRQFINLRPGIQWNHIRSFFSLSSALTIHIDVSDPSHGYVRVNTIDIAPGTPGVTDDPYPWSGSYFHGLPVRLEAIPKKGYAFSHWEGIGAGIATSALIQRTPNQLYQARAVFIPVATSQLITYWYFGTNVANDQPLEFIEPVYDLTDGAILEYHSAHEGYPFTSNHPQWRKASMERRAAPTPLNYRPEGFNDLAYDESSMRGIQVKQPFSGNGGENTLYVKAPTTGFEHIVLRLAAMDEGAADAMAVDYSIAAGGPEWVTTGVEATVWPLNEVFNFYEVDFSNVEEVNNNPDFIFRIRFTGPEMSLDSGYRVTFNNISLDGIATGEVNMPPVVENPRGLELFIEEGMPLLINMNEIFSDPEGDEMNFYASSSMPEHVAATVNGSMLSLTPLKRGESYIQGTASDGLHFPAINEFRVVVYPKAFQFSGNDYQFTEWSSSEPEYSYPEHMMFLQSDIDDPGLNQELPFPYFIAHNDYHADDSGNEGFPYSLTSRTRINALEEDGISFINTGRGRDLGGALLAINTAGMSRLQMEWTTGTIHRNQRVYAIRLQYRTNIHDEFSDLLINSQFQEYMANIDGHTRVVGPFNLPQALLNKEYVQLLWKYYHVSGTSGTRAELRLDDIMIGTTVGIQSNPKADARIYAVGNSIVVEKASEAAAMLTVITMTGQQLLSISLSGSGRHTLPTDIKHGVYIVRLVDETGVISSKLLLGAE